MIEHAFAFDETGGGWDFRGDALFGMASVEFDQMTLDVFSRFDLARLADGYEVKA